MAYWLLFIIKITSTFDESNWFKYDDYIYKHKLQKPCCGHIKSNNHKTTNYTKVNISTL